MVRVLIGISGSGKTYWIQESLIGMHISMGDMAKNIHVIEKKDYNEYSHVFHPDFISVYKPDDNNVDLLSDAKNAEIIIDCENYSEDFLEKVSLIVRQARRNNNNVTITFLRLGNNVILENRILMNANEVLVGKCSMVEVTYIEKLFDVKLPPIKNFDFRKVV